MYSQIRSDTALPPKATRQRTLRNRITARGRLTGRSKRMLILDELLAGGTRQIGRVHLGGPVNTGKASWPHMVGTATFPSNEIRSVISLSSTSASQQFWLSQSAAAKPSVLSTCRGTMRLKNPAAMIARITSAMMFFIVPVLIRRKEFLPTSRADPSSVQSRLLLRSKQRH